MEDWQIETHPDDSGKWGFWATRGNVTLSGCDFDTEDDALIAWRDTLSSQPGEAEPEKPKNDEKPKDIPSNFQAAVLVGVLIIIIGIGWLVTSQSQPQPAPTATASPTAAPTAATVTLYNNMIVSEGCYLYHDCDKAELFALDTSAQIKALNRQKAAEPAPATCPPGICEMMTALEAVLAIIQPMMVVGIAISAGLALISFIAGKTGS